ncbi:MAG: NADH-quinone oxidoreductase subunit G [Desulfobacterales bacterium]|nr:MAG: NADH-quinone oxidoreductase subunit G [Desulfobacterales bacterium]
MAEMIKLFVNGEEVEVEKGKNLIDAVAAVGIEIPHFCYHPALGADGNCRMCLVGIEDGRPPLVPACKTPAAEGMKVLLDAEHIKKIQHDVMELELINHPTDCPICDQAGECKLQDYYMEYEKTESRMRVPQVVKRKAQDFGGGVMHDQERCVLCTRCVRFLRNITKTGELGAVNRGDSACIEFFPGRPINNRYGLNVVDICPVGAMTSKDFRFNQRVWFLKRAESICHGCARGCNIMVDHNKEKYEDDIIYRLRPRHNEQVNGYFMCDEGRMTYKSENDNRLTCSTVGTTEKTLDKVLTEAGQRLASSPKKLFLISPDASLEQMAAVQALAEEHNATLSGFSDGYIKKGDGDDYLICDDKAANRKGLELLGIDCSKKSFETALKEADIFINFASNLSLSYSEEELNALLKTTCVVNCATHPGVLDSKASFTIAVKSWSEYHGIIVNCDGIAQKFVGGVMKNTLLPEITEVAGRLGSPVKDRKSAWALVRQKVAALEEVQQPEELPAMGLKLSEGEAAK